MLKSTNEPLKSSSSDEILQLPNSYIIHYDSQICINNNALEENHVFWVFVLIHFSRGKKWLWRENGFGRGMACWGFFQQRSGSCCKGDSAHRENISKTCGRHLKSTLTGGTWVTCYMKQRSTSLEVKDVIQYFFPR